MNRFLIGACAAAALFAMGCQNRTERAADAQHDAQQTVAKDEQKKAEVDQRTNERVADAQKDAQKDKADLNHDEAKAQRDANQTQAEAARDRDARPGSAGYADNRDRATTSDKAPTGDNTGMVNGQAVTVTGMVKSAGMGGVKLVDDKGGEVKLDTNDSTQVFANGMAVKVGDLKEGDQVRAAYRVDGDDKKATRIDVVHRGLKGAKDDAKH